VNAKNALSPIPGANAIGSLANNPIAIVAKPAANAVAKNTAPVLISIPPYALIIAGLTNKI
jgi:hypothetical protein